MGTGTFLLRGGVKEMVERIHRWRLGWRVFWIVVGFACGVVVQWPLLFMGFREVAWVGLVAWVLVAGWGWRHEAR